MINNKDDCSPRLNIFWQMSLEKYFLYNVALGFVYSCGSDNLLW
jgi:hypothetical protein